MGSSAARKARRRQKKRGSQNPVPPAIFRDSVNSDEAERRHKEMQLTTGVPCLHCPGKLRPGHSSQQQDHINDFDSDTSGRNSAYASQQEEQPQFSPNSVASRGSASKGADTLAGVSLQQKQTKNREKRDLVKLSHDLVTLSRDSHCSPESFAYLQSHLLEETLRTIRDMTPEDAAAVRVETEELVARHGGPVPGEPGKFRLPGIPFPVIEGLLPPPELFSEKQIRIVSHALLDRVVELTDESLPGACAIKNLSKAVSPVLSTVGNMDGASQSAEIVKMEEKTPLGKQMNLGKHDSNDDKNDAAKLKEQVRPVMSSNSATTTKPVHEGFTSPRTSGMQNISPKSSQQANMVTKQIVLTRIEDLSNKLRRSIEIDSDRSGPTQEAMTLREANGHASSDDDNSFGDSGAKPNLGRARRTTKGGIFDFKASPLKTDSGILGRKEERRRVSLQLPVNVSKSQSAQSRQMIARSNSPAASTEDGFLSSTEAEEREMEYKHRHIFIGTASLDDFLEILEVTPHHTTTRESVVKAFGTLACTEQLQARQSSISPDGWAFVTRTTRDDILTSTDYLSESRIKLGSISLGKFLSNMPFNENTEIDAVKVVEGFCLASHLDTEAIKGSHSKAKAFRSWLVSRKASMEDA